MQSFAKIKLRENFQIYSTHAEAHTSLIFKETKSATMNTFRFFFLFKSFVKVELSHVFKINLFTIAENCTEN